MVSIVTSSDILETLGGGNKPTGVWRLVIGTLSAAAILGWSIVGYFVRDELTLLRDAQVAVTSSLAATNATVATHVAADVDSRSQSSQARFTLDTRVTKLEQTYQDFSQEISNSRAQSLDQARSIYDQLNKIRDVTDKLGRDVSVIQGSLGRDGVPRGGQN